MAWTIEKYEAGEPVYAYIPEYTPKRITIKELTAQINELQAQKVAMVEPLKEELIEHGKAFHPYYTDRQRIQDEIDSLKVLRDQLRLM